MLVKQFVGVCFGYLSLPFQGRLLGWQRAVEAVSARTQFWVARWKCFFGACLRCSSVPFFCRFFGGERWRAESRFEEGHYAHFSGKFFWCAL